MYDELLARSKEGIESVRTVLKTNEALRALVFSDEEGEAQEFKRRVIARIGVTPDSTLWRVHDHCAAITRLYAIYERFVVEIVRDWLGLLPALTANYQSLASVHEEHRKGVARVLQNLGSAKYRNLTALDAVRGFYQAVSGAEAYELLPEAFTVRSQNYRQEILQEIFNSVAVVESWAWIQAHRQVRDYVGRIGEDSTKVENELKQFVQDRNDAAHGLVDEVLSVTRIIEISELVEALCVAICEMLSWQVVSRKESNGAASPVGDVTEKFTSGAVVAKMRHVKFQRGDRFYVCGTSCCYPVTVESIRLNDVDQPRMVVTAETEVGLKFDREVKTNRKLYKVETTAATKSHFRLIGPSDVDVVLEPFHSPQGKHGILLRFHNRRLASLLRCGVVVQDVRSFDFVRNSFRESRGFKAVRVIMQDCGAGFESRNLWLVRIEGDHLEVGDTVNEGAMHWPTGDTSNRERWRFYFSVTSTGLEEWKPEADIEWVHGSETIRLLLPEVDKSQ